MELSIQERLKDLRVERGLTLEQLAEKTHLSKSALGSYEGDNFKDISHYALIELAKFYEVTVDYLLGRTSYRYSLDTLNEEYAPGMTVAELVDIIQHFSRQNTVSFLDYIELLQLRQKAEDCSSTS